MMWPIFLLNYYRMMLAILRHIFLLSILLIIAIHINAMESSISIDKIVIAHRGASGYLPEHTLEAKALAYGMGADYLEQDVVLTKDNEVIVLHDPFLDRVSDVMEQYPDRFRIIEGVKRWLALDFTLAEIRTLNATEGFKLTNDGTKVANYPERFPLFKSRFEIPTLAEEIEFIQGLNKSMGKNVGIYVEVKAPWLHQMYDRDISKITLELIKSYGYTKPDNKVYIQCFDPVETERIAKELYPELNIKLPLIQLIAETSWNETQRLVDGKLQNYSYDWMAETGAMKQVSEYADGIGPWYPMLITQAESSQVQPSLMLTEAKAAGLVIHPYTFRKDDGEVPSFANDFTDYLDIYYRQLDVDGVFTDFPDLAVNYLRSLTSDN